MSTKYKFIAILPNEVEIDSEFDVEGKVVWPSYSQSEPIRLKGIFDSYEEAKVAADNFKAYDAIVYNDCGGGYIEELHSFYCDDEYPVAFLSPDDADEWIRVRLECISDNKYDEDEDDEAENEDIEDEEEEEQEKFTFEEIKILEIQIVEIEK